MIMKLLIASITVLSLCVLASAQRPCMPRRCNRTRPFENGISRGRRAVNSTKSFRCNPGYILQGRSSLTCMCIDGRAVWSDKIPICVSEEENTITCAVAALTEGSLSGTLCLREENGTVKVKGTVTNLPQGPHGFHVHQYGDFSNGCASAAGHYNPLGRTHGAPSDDERHVGDLGNIIGVASNTSTVDIEDSLISLNGPLSIVGRSIVIHRDGDDLGTAGDAGSMATGNAGPRLGCGVIATVPCSTPPCNT